MEKRRNLIMAALAVMISLMLTACVWRTETVSAKVEKTQEHMAEEVLRFHVLANSDSKEDQNLKMKVKDTVVSWMEEEMDTESLAQTKAFIRSHLPQIEALAEETIQKEGYSYPVWASLEWTVFPEKTYGDITFPAGTYEALRIQIGEAQGHNWWCVMFPDLCVTKDDKVRINNTARKKMEKLLGKKTIRKITKDKYLGWLFEV